MSRTVLEISYRPFQLRIKPSMNYVNYVSIKNANLSDLLKRRLIKV